MNFCPDCRGLTSGNCGKHAGTYFSYSTDPIACVICKLSHFGMTRLPYPSRRDGDYICNDCLARLVDAAVKVICD